MKVTDRGECHLKQWLGQNHSGKDSWGLGKRPSAAIKLCTRWSQVAYSAFTKDYAPYGPISKHEWFVWTTEKRHHRSVNSCSGLW